MEKVDLEVALGDYTICGVPVLSSPATREIECKYGANTSTDFRLMQAAASAIFKGMQAIISDEMKDKRWVIFAGSGNNGGDGYEIATSLLESGCRDTVVISVLPLRQGICANLARERFLDAGGVEYPFVEFKGAQNDIKPFTHVFSLASNADYIVDAVAGIGINNDFDIERHSARLMRVACSVINASKQAMVLAVDIPSLLNAATGLPVAPEAVRANHTFVVFGYRTGVLLGRAADYCGQLHTAYPCIDGMNSLLQESVKKEGVLAYDYSCIKNLIPLRQPCDHKGNSGRVLAVGGGKGMHGALMLCASCALRAGAGLVTASFVDPQGAFSLNVYAPEIMTLCLESKSLEKCFTSTKTVVLGPGLGRDEEGAGAFEQVVSALPNDATLIIDADGLWHLRNMYDSMNRWYHNSVFILTPHVGEAAYLLNCSSQEVLEDQLGCARRLAQKYNAVCVLKSCRTVIAFPDESSAFVGVVGSQAMASGGMGDLLGGVIASLCASGVNYRLASLLGVAIHGRAGELCGQQNGEAGTCASDLLPYIRLLRNRREQ